MKRLMIVTTAVFFASAGVVFAAGNATVGVSASVVGTCKFNSGGTVAFGNLDPATGGAVSATVTQPSLWCTKGTAYTITDDTGLYFDGANKRMKHASLVEYIPYSFTYTAGGTGSGKSTAIDMDIASDVAEADYIDASAGGYADTVTLTVNP